MGHREAGLRGGNDVRDIDGHPGRDPTEERRGMGWVGQGRYKPTLLMTAKDPNYAQVQRSTEVPPRVLEIKILEDSHPFPQKKHCQIQNRASPGVRNCRPKQRLK